MRGKVASAFARQPLSVQRLCVRRFFLFGTIACLLWATSFTTVAEDAFANGLYGHAVGQISRASELERRGKKEEAIEDCNHAIERAMANAQKP